MLRPLLSTTLGLVLATTMLTPAVAAPAQTLPIYQLQAGDLVLAAKPQDAKTKVRVAVVDFKTIGAPATFGEAVAENLRNSLVAHQRFTVVERGQIEKALKEAQFSQSGLVDGRQAVTLGRLLGAKVIVVGSVTKLGSTYTVNARFIDVQTGEATDAKSLKTDDEDRIAHLVDRLAAALSGVTSGDRTAAGLADVDDDSRKQVGETQTVSTGKSKLLASSMSFLLPGVGQFYNGNWGWGLAQGGLNVLGFLIAIGGRQQNDNSTAGLGYLTMMMASLWSSFDGWFTTQEQQAI